MSLVEIFKNEIKYENEIEMKSDPPFQNFNFNFI